MVAVRSAELPESSVWAAIREEVPGCLGLGHASAGHQHVVQVLGCFLPSGVDAGAEGILKTGVPCSKSTRSISQGPSPSGPPPEVTPEPSPARHANSALPGGKDCFTREKSGASRDGSSSPASSSCPANTSQMQQLATGAAPGHRIKW